MVLFVLLFAAGFKTQGYATDANVVSPVITYQYLDEVGEQTNVPVVSPVITYQYLDALPNATYQTQTSPSVVYYYQSGNQAGPLITGVTPNPVSGMDGAQSFTISGGNFNGSSVVNLTNLTTGISYPNRAILSENGTQIVIKPNFGTAASTWTVQVANGLIASSPYQFTVQAATHSTLQAPIMNSPGATAAPGDVQVNPAINFSWQLVSGADRYDFFISQLNTSGGYDLVFSTQASGINLSGTTNSYTLPSGVLKSGGSYRWTMSSHNSAGSGVPSSAFLYFRTPVATSVLPPPTLVGLGSNVPPGQSASSTTPQFTWQPVNGADGYNIYVNIQNPDCTYSPVFDTHALGLTQSAAARSFTMPSGYLQPGHRYLWKMSTENSAGNGPQNTPGLYFQTGTTPSNPPLKINWLTLSPSQADWCKTITFQGKVVDDNGNAVSGAVLTAADPLASGPLLSPPSNAGGFISFPLTVPVNTASKSYTYSFQATKAGYTPSVNWSLQLQVNHTSSVPVINVIYPTAGATISTGTIQTITATSTGSVTGYSFELSRNGGLSWSPLGKVATTSNAARLAWVPSGPASSQCIIRVTVDSLEECVWGTSGVFSIVEPSTSVEFLLPGFIKQSQLGHKVDDFLNGINPHSINGEGCLLTSVSMMLRYDGFPYNDPVALNTRLKGTSAFIGPDLYSPTAVSIATEKAYTRKGVSLAPFTGEGDDMTNAFGRFLKDKLQNDNRPVMVEIIGSKTHFVVVIGWDSQGFIIADPAQLLTDLSTRHLEDGYQIGHNSKWNSVHNIQSYTIIGYLSPQTSQGQMKTPRSPAPRFGPTPTPTAIQFSILNNADILVMDPNGAQTGMNPLAGGEIQQIPNAAHFMYSLSDVTSDAPPTSASYVCELSDPIAGTYTVSVIGVAEGSYVLRILQEMSDGSISINYIDGVAAPGSVDSYTLQVGTSADLSISGTVSAPFVQSGSSVTCSWTVSNNGDNQASAVTMTDTLPLGCSLITANPERYQYNSSTGTVTFGIGNLSPGASQTISLTVTTDTIGTVASTALVSSFEPDANPDDNTATATTTVIPAVTFAEWQASHFTEPQLNDPAICGPLAIPHADGIPNLVKYAFDISPSAPMSALDRAALPSIGMQSQGGFQYLMLTYRRNVAATGILFDLQMSPNLLPGSWTTVTPDFVSQSAADVAGDVFITEMLKVTGADKSFIRLSVTQP